MKKQYEAPAMELIAFDVEEALNDSTGGNMSAGGSGGYEG